jgi:hypothetical protein
MHHDGAQLQGSARRETKPLECAPIIPPGTPTWITPALIASTLDVWQPHFAKPLTTADAIDILSDVGRLMDILEN